MTATDLSRPVSLNALQRLGFFCLALYLYLLHGRALDRLYFLHIPFIVCCAAILLAVATGGVLRVFNSRVGIALLLLTAWMALASGTGIWIGGSIWTFRELWLPSLMLFILIVGLTITYDQCRTAMKVMAWSAVTLALVAFIRGSLSEGRLIITESRYANPNELGQMLVMGLAFLWYVIADARATGPRRALAVLAAAPMLVAAARTGSRSAFIGFGVLVFQLFLQTSLANKVKIVMAAALTLVVAALLLPQDLKDRYLTFLQPKTSAQLALESVPQGEATAQMESEAIGSTEARWNLLVASVKLTMQHPFLGVGTGNFMPGQDAAARKEGKPRGIWQLTHNTYTELSSENGIPALLFYLVALFGCYRMLGRLTRIGKATGGVIGADIVNASSALNLALTSYAVAGCFGSFAYHSYFTVIGGLITAWYLAVPLAVRQEAKTFRAPASESPVQARRNAGRSPGRLHPVWTNVQARRRRDALSTIES